MESPHLYENIEFKKNSLNMKNKSYSEVSEYELDNLSNPEMSMNLQNFIADSIPNMQDQHAIAQDALCQGLSDLNVDKSQGFPRGMGANPTLNCLPPVSGENMYLYMPQAVHNSSQYDQFGDDRLSIKEEPRENSHEALRDYQACTRMGYPGYNNYPLTPTMVPGADQGLLKSPHKSPTCLLKASPKKCGNQEDYRRRRERNNIAVRKSREKAKLRTKETEERVKALQDENRSLKEVCNALTQETSVLKSVVSHIRLDMFAEPVRSEIRSMLEIINFNIPHRGGM